MSQAFKCEICGEFFTPNSKTGAHTMLLDGIPNHASLDFCESCTEGIINYINTDITNRHKASEEIVETPESE